MIGETVTVEIDGERYTFAADVDALAFAHQCEEDAETEGDTELIAWGWKATALLLAARVENAPPIECACT